MPSISRPQLCPYSLADALEAIQTARPGLIMITMSSGQWDHILEGLYREGAVLLELDDDENPVAAYCAPGKGVH